MSRRSTILHALCGIGLLAACTPALSQELGEWRALTAEEEKSHKGDVPADSADPLSVEADFDGDGRKDKALIAARRADGIRDLIVRMGDRIHVLVRSEEGGASVGAEDGLGLAEPGRWETICGNAFRDLQGGLCESEQYPEAVTLKHPGLLHISPGEAMLYFWNRKKKTFDAVGLRN
ncbi:hypothetical protein ACFOYU_25140 [Microvirga sp. GCM10011540]|uniref:hypothetical protein n=1 Tax=Microvirga sp. GCM10011540 TaxID=3317338 RepID=UPI003620E225